MAAYTNSVCGWWIVVLMSYVVLMICDNNEVFGCLESEKIALLKLKDVLKGYQLRTGSDKEPDCCRWNWVTCDVFSKRIINLSLTPYEEDVWYLEDNWYLNASLFQPFEQLQNLTIHRHRFEGFTGQLKLKKLQVLDLSDNAISHVPLLGELQSLRFLDLSYNAMSNGFEELKNLSINLEYLNLNDFNYNHNGVSKIPLSIWALASLKVLGLSLNELNGSLPKGLCALNNLEELDLSINGFEGVIPTCLSNLTSLRLLALDRNKLSGTIPSNVFSSLNALEYVSLSENYFDGLFSFNSFANNSKLEVFELQYLNPGLKVDTEIAKWKYSIFQLKVLKLSNSRVIPSFLLSQYDLRYVDLRGNGMTGELPSWLLANNSRLESLDLSNNSFTGRLALQLDSYNADLYFLDVSMNQVAGEIPTFIGSALPNLTYWDMSENAIEGSIPSSIENMSELYSLDFSNNRLSGEIPGRLFTRCEELTYLKLSNNKLEGNFLPKNMSKPSKLWYLSLGSNNLSGDLTHGRLETLSLAFGSVRYFDISNNSISGRFPDWISELSTLSILVMSKNQLEGKLPTSFCNLTMLKLIDLSSNNFSDTLPLCTNLSSLHFLHLGGNRFHGPLPTSLSRSSSIVTLDVSNNNFSDFIPAWISSLMNLMVLLLNGNLFHGSISSELCQLKNLNILDLSANNLSGYVPPCLSQIPFGKSKFTGDIFDLIDDEEDSERKFGSYSYENRLHISLYAPERAPMTSFIQEDVLLITKSMFESYKGNILYFMSSIDLSLNKLTGPIPLDIGNWDMVHSLNLSYNNFNGSIPWNISRLKALESLDLSHNMLSGEIPSPITELNFLSAFSVAYNNLSGLTPTRTRQFATFNLTSYEGNPLLYGCPLDRSCNGRSPPLQHAKPSTKSEPNGLSYEITFLCSFFGSFVVSCIGAFVFFYFNTNVPDILLGWIGVKRVTRRTTVELPWMWNK